MNEHKTTQKKKTDVKHKELTPTGAVGCYFF